MATDTPAKRSSEQQSGPDPPEQVQRKRKGDPATRSQTLIDAMIPPELLLRHSRDLRLDEAQIQAIREEIKKAQDRFPEMQRRRLRQTAALIEQVRLQRIDPEKAAESLDKVLDAEREIKRSQLILILTVLNQLTSQRQETLDQLRQQMATEARSGFWHRLQGYNRKSRTGV